MKPRPTLLLYSQRSPSPSFSSTLLQQQCYNCLLTATTTPSNHPRHASKTSKPTKKPLPKPIAKKRTLAPPSPSRPTLPPSIPRSTPTSIIAAPPPPPPPAKPSATFTQKYDDLPWVKKIRASLASDDAPLPYSPKWDANNEALNPPEWTYAPPLVLPVKEYSGPLGVKAKKFAKRLWAVGKAYLQFYKQGVKNVWAMVKLARKLRARQKKEVGGLSKDKKAVGSRDEKAAGEEVVKALVADIVLTRAEWQIVQRSQKDVYRLPFFATLLALFGEYTPLIKGWITFIIPEPCREPTDLERSLKKREARRAERLQVLKRTYDTTVIRKVDTGVRGRTGNAVIRVDATSPDVKDLKSWHWTDLLALSSRLDAHPWVWEFFMTPPRFIVQWDVKRKLNYLRMDDALIARDGGWRGLNEVEVKRACVDRGIIVNRRTPWQMRMALAEWFGEELEEGVAKELGSVEQNRLRGVETSADVK